MDYLAAAEALARRRLLERICDGLSDEDRRLLAQMAVQRKASDEIIETLRQQSSRLDRLQLTQQTFSSDLASNILGNAVWDGALWLLKRLAR